MSDTPYALPVDTTAAQKGYELIGKFARRLDEDTFCAVLRELMMDEYAYYDEMGNFQLALTDMQAVALGYSLAAFIKGGGSWDGQTAWGGRHLADEVTFL